MAGYRFRGHRRARAGIQALAQPKETTHATQEEHDFPAAESYLALIYPSKRAAQLTSPLRAAKITQFKAKDIFRASRLSLLGISNAHVEKDKQKISNGKILSPLLLVRDETNARVVVADGYHRLCAVHTFDEDALISCKIV